MTFDLTKPTVNLHFDHSEMINVLYFNGYTVSEAKRSYYATDDYNKPKTLNKDIFIVYLDGEEVLDTSYPCSYEKYEIVERIFNVILQEKLMELLLPPIKYEHARHDI